MKITNAEIFGLATKFDEAFKGNNSQYLPAKINFIIHRNVSTLLKQVDSIEKVRLDILTKYGVYNEQNNQYYFSDDTVKQANQELQDLLNITQDIDIIQLSINDLEGLNFTPMQMQAILFMIKED